MEPRAGLKPRIALDADSQPRPSVRLAVWCEPGTHHDIVMGDLVKTVSQSYPGRHAANHPVIGYLDAGGRRLGIVFRAVSDDPAGGKSGCVRVRRCYALHKVIVNQNRAPRGAARLIDVDRVTRLTQPKLVRDLVPANRNIRVAVQAVEQDRVTVIFAILNPIKIERDLRSCFAPILYDDTASGTTNQAMLHDEKSWLVYLDAVTGWQHPFGAVVSHRDWLPPVASIPVPAE